MASARGENAGKRSIERAGNLLLAELLQTAWGLFVEQNFFNETEQSALAPGNLVPGIEPSEDRLNKRVSYIVLIQLKKKLT